MDSSNHIKFSCPSCGKKFRLESRYAGKKARCPQCHAIFTIPALARQEHSATAELPPQKGGASPDSGFAPVTATPRDASPGKKERLSESAKANYSQQLNDDELKKLEGPGGMRPEPADTPASSEKKIKPSLIIGALSAVVRLQDYLTNRIRGLYRYITSIRNNKVLPTAVSEVNSQNTREVLTTSTRDPKSRNTKIIITSLAGTTLLLVVGVILALTVFRTPAPAPQKEPAKSADSAEEELPKIICAEPDDLLYAIKQGDLPMVKALLIARPMLIETKFAGLWTPLHVAALNGQKEIAIFLISKGAAVDAGVTLGKPEWGGLYPITPLLLAVIADHKDVAEYLLGYGADPNGEVLLSRGNRPVNRPFRDMVDLLDKWGANFNKREYHVHFRPLDLAKSEEMREMLRQHGAIKIR